jgi:hypothetical protein
METGVKTAFNVIFKELIMHVRNETSDKELKASIKTKYKKFETEGDVYLTEYVPTDVTIVDRKLDVIEASLSDADAVERMKGIIALLDVLSTLSERGVASCILVHVYDAILKRSAEDLGSVILDQHLLDSITTAVEGIDEDTVNAFGTAKLSKPASTDIMSIAKDVSKTINIEELMKNGMDPNSSSMQDMVSNVSKDIQSRIDSGEVNQEQLMKEATDLLGSLGGGGGLEGMMKMMGGGGGIAEMMKMMGGAGFGPTEDDDFVAPVSEAPSKKGKKASRKR